MRFNIPFLCPSSPLFFISNTVMFSLFHSVLWNKPIKQELAFLKLHMTFLLSLIYSKAGSWQDAMGNKVVTIKASLRRRKSGILLTSWKRSHTNKLTSHLLPYWFITLINYITFIYALGLFCAHNLLDCSLSESISSSII